MKRIEKERLFELKRLKELEWLGKRKEKEKEVASNVAKEHLNNIIDEAWDELNKNSKNIRLEKAAFCTLAARTSTWRISDSGAASPKRKREGDWHTANTPLKKLRGLGGGGSILNLPECTVAKYPPPPSSSQVQDKIKNIEEKVSKGGPEKTPPPKKMPQVKTKKWMKGKNGLIRWVSSLKPGIYIEPNQTEGVKKQGKDIFGKCGGDGPAAEVNTDQSRK